MKYKKLISRMSLEEKAAFLTGKNVWESRDYPQYGIPSCFFADGPHGLRKQAGAADHLGLNASLPATCFPTAAAMAASWDPELCREVGRALGREANRQEVSVLLGPGLNIKRSPLCGRNFEYFSEDPYLSGKLGAAYVRGIESQGVSSCPKHFAVNNQEYRRMTSNSVLDERTLREIYLTGFEIVVKEGKPKTIMSAYNEINGTYAHENRHLLTEILRDEWGFTGAVISDWGGANDSVAAVRNGGTLEMPSAGGDSTRQLIRAVTDGDLNEADLDARVAELLGIVAFHRKKPAATETTGQIMQENNRLARKAALSCAVLLKNENEMLPLKPGKKTALIGSFAEKPRYQGAGSSVVNTPWAQSTLDCIPASGIDMLGFARGFRRDGTPDEELKQKAVTLARQADVVLLYLGLNESGEVEGADREHMDLPANQVGLLSALAAVNTNIIVIISAGAPVVTAWEEYCRAIVYAGLGGQAGAGAVLDLLTGKESPRGRLAETFPVRLEDTPACHYYPAREKDACYREGLYVGYRYYDKVNAPVAYPFGFGLSYTSFAYSDLEITGSGVSFRVSNTGTNDGIEVAQLYVGCKNSQIYRPGKELKGFQKVCLKAGESKPMRIPFDDKTFRYFDTRTNCWETEQNQYEIMIGANVADIRLSGTLAVAGRAGLLNCCEELPSYYTGRIKAVDDAEFSRLLGRTLPEKITAKTLGVNDSLSQMHRAGNSLARVAGRVIECRMNQKQAAGRPDLNLIFIYNMPFRAIAKMTEGRVDMVMVGSLLEMVNGHFFRGIKGMTKGYFANRRANKLLKQRLERKRRNG